MATVAATTDELHGAVLSAVRRGHRVHDGDGGADAHVVCDQVHARFVMNARPVLGALVDLYLAGLTTVAGGTETKICVDEMNACPVETGSGETFIYLCLTESTWNNNRLK